MIKRYIILIISAVLLLGGLYVRWSNLFHVGFYYDTVDYFYRWGNTAREWGFANFWKNYTGEMDYVPGSLYLLTGISFISTYFKNSSPEAFVATLKIVLFIADICLSYVFYVILRLFAKTSKQVALLVASIIFVIPPLWFVSGVIGQIDTLVSLCGIAGIVCFYIADTSILSKRDYRFWALISGILIALSFWLKMLIILIAPAAFVLFITVKNKKVLGYALLSFLITTLLILAIPFQSNPTRVMSTLLVPQTRFNTTTNGASNFWAAIGYFGDSRHVIFQTKSISLRPDNIGLIIYVTTSLLLIALALRSYITSKEKVTISFHNFCWITSVTSFAFFLFMVKVAARYLHITALFIIITMVLTKSSKEKFTLLILTAILEGTYFLNLIGGYTWWKYTQPLWPSLLFQSLHFDVARVCAQINVALFITVLAIGIKHFLQTMQTNR